MKNKYTKYLLICILAAIIIGIISFFIVRSLGNKPNSNIADTPDNNPIEQTTEQSSEQYIVIENNTKIRQEPTINSSEIITLKIGDKVEIIKKSETLSRVSEYSNYWYNIKFKDKIGWVFGEQITNKSNIEGKIAKKYEQFLNSLSQKDVSSITQGIDTYKAYTSMVTKKSVNDDMFRFFRKYYEKVLSNQVFTETEQALLQEHMQNYENELYDLKNADKISNSALKNKIYILKQNGFRIAASEGQNYIDEDAYFLLSNFGDTVTEGINEFLSIRSKEIKEGFSEDASLMISWNQISDRIIDWDNYLKRYSSYPESKEVKAIIDTIYLPAYLTGMDNTPAFDWETKILNDDLKKSFKRFIENYQNSTYYQVINEYYDILKKNNFVLNDEVEYFLKRKGFNNIY